MLKVSIVLFFLIFIEVGYCNLNKEINIPLNSSANIKVIQDFSWKDLSKKILTNTIGSFYDKAYSIIESEVKNDEGLEETFNQYLSDFFKAYYEENTSLSIPESITSEDIQVMITNMIDTELTTENIAAFLGLFGIINLSSEGEISHQDFEDSDTFTKDENITNDIVLITSDMSFRGFPMGNSIETFQSVFRGETIDSYDTDYKTKDYYFREDFVGIPAVNYFSFYNDSFYQGTAIFKIDTTNDDNYISTYQMLKDKLKEKYGEPTYEVERGSNNSYISDALSIKTGDGIFYCYWDIKEKYRITLVLQGDNYKFQFYLRYQDQDTEKIIDKIIEEKKYSEL